MMASKPRSVILQQRSIKPLIPVAPWGKFCMKSKISASLAFSKQMVSNPRIFRELKKLAFICSVTLPLGDVSVVVNSLLESLELTSLMLELVMD